jgi:hypothetical protein
MFVVTLVELTLWLVNSLGLKLIVQHASSSHDIDAAFASFVQSGIRFNEHMEGDGPTVFAHACKMGLEGIVSKRKDSAYRSGRSPDWLKLTRWKPA